MELKVQERRAWRREFDELGATRVRKELTLGRWPRDKRDAARKWLEQEDIAHWQQNVSTGAGPYRFLSKKTLGIVAAIAFGAFALSRLWRLWS
jgi:hypothetical protein